MVEPTRVESDYNHKQQQNDGFKTLTNSHDPAWNAVHLLQPERFSFIPIAMAIRFCLRVQAK